MKLLWRGIKEKLDCLARFMHSLHFVIIYIFIKIYIIIFLYFFKINLHHRI